MKRVASSPLAALTEYYRRLEAEPGQGVPAFGFAREKIHFEVVLEPDGSSVVVQDLREATDRGRKLPRLMEVPDGGGRSGTAMKPFFCWDNTGYALGADAKGRAERARQMFGAFRDLHLSLRGEVGNDPGFNALCSFLERWDPTKAEAIPGWEEAAGLNVVFRVRGCREFVHQSDSVRTVWARHASPSADGDPVHGLSLLTGRQEELARLHALIGGVANANTTGAAIVSFNDDAYTSYGKTQSYNAPVGVHDAFRYTTALGYLLSDATRRVRMGDATVVFWTDRAEATDAEEVFRAFFAEETPRDASAEAGKLVDRLRAFLLAAREGRLEDELRDPEAPFYVLGLSPNASRLNVRFWLAGTAGEFARSLARHADDLAIVGERVGDPPLAIRRLLLETAREPKDVAPRLAGEVARAVLAGVAYPRSLLAAVIRRVRADGVLNHRRAAILKAVLVRNSQKEVPVALDKDHPQQAYHLGRLFAVLEKTQEGDGSGRNLNSTIKDRYFGAAAATPGAVFPLLLRLHQHHLNKIQNVGLRVVREKLVGEVCGHLTRFPTHLGMHDQGLFYVGYYHQRQDFFTKKTEDAKEVVNA